MTVSPSFRFSLLSGQDRGAFDCGVSALNDYLRRFAGQDQKRGIATCHLMEELATGRIAGFYTLSAAQIAWRDVPDELDPGGRYNQVPAALLGRLAVDLGFQGQKLGRFLVLNAISRCLHNEVAMALMIVEAKDSRAADFYAGLGFQPDPDAPLRLMANMLRLRNRLLGAR